MDPNKEIIFTHDYRISRKEPRNIPDELSGSPSFNKKDFNRWQEGLNNRINKTNRPDVQAQNLKHKGPGRFPKFLPWLPHLRHKGLTKLQQHRLKLRLNISPRLNTSRHPSKRLNPTKPDHNDPDNNRQHSLVQRLDLVEQYHQLRKGYQAVVVGCLDVGGGIWCDG